MKKAARKKNSSSSSNAWNILLIVVLIIVGLGIGTLFVVKSKEKARMATTGPSIVEASFLHIGPDKGCTTDEIDLTLYTCNIGIQNTANEPMEWVGYVGNIEGATLSDSGVGVVDAGKSAVVTLTVPIAFCNDPYATGKVTLIDKSRSSNQGEVTFSCSSEGASDSM